MAYKIPLSLTMERAYLFMKNESPRARFLIISAHGCQAKDKPPINPNGRTFVFYGPHGKVVTTPPIEEIIKRVRWAVPYETYTQDLVEDYTISKYAGSQNKLGIDYESFKMDLDVWDEAGAYHIFSVARRLKGWFGKGDLLLSQAIEMAETWNKQQYEQVYCCFCRGVAGQPVRGSRWEHTYLDNRAGATILR